MEHATSAQVIDNRSASQYELAVQGATAILVYDRDAGRIVLVHTEVPEALRGKGVGDALVKGSLALARAEGLHVVPACPFVKAYLRKHPEEA